MGFYLMVDGIVRVPINEGMVALGIVSREFHVTRGSQAKRCVEFPFPLATQQSGSNSECFGTPAFSLENGAPSPH